MKSKTFNSFADLAAHKTQESRKARLSNTDILPNGKIVEPITKTRQRIRNARAAKKVAEPVLKTYRGEPYAEFEWEGFTFHVRCEEPVVESNRKALPVYRYRSVTRGGSSPWTPMPKSTDQCNYALRALLQKAAGLL